MYATVREGREKQESPVQNHDALLESPDTCRASHPLDDAANQHLVNRIAAMSVRSQSVAVAGNAGASRANFGRGAAREGGEH